MGFLRGLQNGNYGAVGRPEDGKKGAVRLGFHKKSLGIPRDSSRIPGDSTGITRCSLGVTRDCAGVPRDSLGEVGVPIWNP